MTEHLPREKFGMMLKVQLSKHGVGSYAEEKTLYKLIRNTEQVAQMRGSKFTLLWPKGKIFVSSLK